MKCRRSSLAAADGMLYGGCLSLLCASLGTPYEVETRDTVLFLEDLAEPAFRIDRMLMQLKLAGKFEGVRGVIFGEMLNCGPRGEQEYTLQEVVQRVLGDLDVPIAYGLKSGHVSRGNITLPFGCHDTVHRRRKSIFEPRGCRKPRTRKSSCVQIMKQKHIHLIGICGTAMASLAGMLKQRGHHVTGSDLAAYPPMSDFLASLGIPVAQPFSEKNLEPRPDLVIVGNAISRGNVELESVLDQRLAYQSMAQMLHDEFLVDRERW